MDLDSQSAFATLSSPKTALNRATSNTSALESAASCFRPSRSLNLARIEGKYAGIAFGVGVPDNYQITLRYIGGAKFVGKAEARNSSNSSLFVNTSLQGRVVEGSLLLKQARVIRDNLPTGFFPCLRAGQLNISIEKKKLALSGPWISKSASCGSSQIRLQKLS
jgi:hypothetical protein